MNGKIEVEVEEESAKPHPLIGILIGLPFAILFTFPQIFINGFVASKLWLWHFVPLGLPLLSWKVFAVGAMIRGIYTNKAPRPEPVTEEDIYKKRLYNWMCWFGPGVSLLLGWLLR